MTSIEKDKAPLGIDYRQSLSNERLDQLQLVKCNTHLCMRIQKLKVKRNSHNESGSND